MELTKVMKKQLLESLWDMIRNGDYWGSNSQFWKRHDKIIEWVEEQEVGR